MHIVGERSNYLARYESKFTLFSFKKSIVRFLHYIRSSVILLECSICNWLGSFHCFWEPNWLSIPNHFTARKCSISSRNGLFVVPSFTSCCHKKFATTSIYWCILFILRDTRPVIPFLVTFIHLLVVFHLFFHCSFFLVFWSFFLLSILFASISFLTNVLLFILFIFAYHFNCIFSNLLAMAC